MEWLGFAGLLSLFALCVCIVHEYAQREVPFRVKSLTVLSWLFCFSAYTLLPFDIYYTTHQPASAHREAIRSLWSLLYWGNFAFSWAVLPFLMYYETSGGFDCVRKVKISLWENFLYYVYFAVGALPVLAFTYSMGMLERIKLVDLAVAASNSIGIFLCIVCMGYSIPHFPVALLKHPKNTARLKELQYEINYSKSLLGALKLKMALLAHQLAAFESQSSLPADFSRHIEEIKKHLPTHLPQKPLAPSGAKHKPGNSQQAPSLCELESLHKNAKLMKEEMSRLKRKEATLSKKAMFLEDVVDSLYLSNHKIRGVMATLSDNSTSHLFKIKFVVRVWPWLSRAVGVLSAVLSLLLITVEVLGFCNKQIDDYFREMISQRDNWFVAGLSLAIFGYAILCVHFAVFKFKLTGFYNLYSNKQTDSSSLLYSGINFSRVSSALCLNFLSILDIEDSSFNRVMGTFSVVPIFGETFQRCFPLTLLFFVVFNLTDVYGKLMRTLGLKSWQFNQSEAEELQSEGQKLESKFATSPPPTAHTSKRESADEEELFSPGKMLHVLSEKSASGSKKYSRVFFNDI